MAAGDVTVELLDIDTTAIDTAVTNARVTANDHYLLAGVSDGKQLIFVHIEEA